MVWRIVHLCGVTGRQYDLQYIEEKACRRNKGNPWEVLVARGQP
jgi:hypothetical protein